jgi:hypothetical protein
VPANSPGIGGRHRFVKDGDKSVQRSNAKSAMTTQPDKKDTSSLGNALRAVYHDAVGESVPDEMLDLLNKLK